MKCILKMESKLKKMSVVKWTVRIALLLFVAASVGYLFANEYAWKAEPVPSSQISVPPEQSEKAVDAAPDRVVAYYFHGNFRCASCRKIEEYSRAAIEEGFSRELKKGKLEFSVVNVEESPNRHFIRDYSLVTKSLVLVLKEGDRQVRYKNLDLVWQLLGSRDQFITYVQNEVKGFLGEVRR